MGVAQGVSCIGETVAVLTTTAAADEEAETAAGRVVGSTAPTGQTVVYKIVVDVMTISDWRDAGQCRTVEEHEVMVIRSVEVTVEVIKAGEVIVPLA